MTKALLPALLLFGMAGAQVLTIAQAREDADGDGIPDLLGQTVTISGVATCETTLFSTSGVSFYVQDATAGINVYAYEAPMDLMPGEEWEITGEIKVYNGLTEISPSSVDDYEYVGNPGMPQPVQLLRNQPVSESLEGMLLAAGNPGLVQWVTVATSPSYAGGGYNFDVWNGQTVIPVRVNETTGIDVSGISQGTRLFLKGIGGQYDSTEPYDSGYQLLPRYQTDITVFNPAIDNYFHLDVSGNPFAPVLGETCTIEYGGPQGVRFNLTVYDRAGRDLAGLAINSPAGDVFSWDGRDDMNQYLPMGQYLLLLEAVYPDGDRLTTTETVVIAAPLE
ncbi:MAG TPA: hypothetical protein PLM22_08460 [Candidatus Sabulitectum sp.]|nr:hypothetical protein [Candidatus Sabulitectum sp.]HPF31772.1 hypothetical protein [Candidatus Sabulitectum sp.]HPJ28950.1 hypothetical protein [Candidatus Sabulitectum sp.]HPR22297.1 hypothetical protein [Candidatus Sabulitectum sp.]